VTTSSLTRADRPGDFLQANHDPHASLRRLAAAYIFGAVALGLQFLHGTYANLLLIAIALVLVAYVPRHLTGTVLHAADWTYLFYIGFIMASAAWSLAPVATAEQAGPLIIPWVAALILCGLQKEWVAHIVVKIALAASLLSPLTILISKSLAYQPHSTTGAPELRGVFGHQLYLGAFLTVALGLVAISYLNGQARSIVGGSRLVRVLVILAIVGVLFLSRTRIYVAMGLLALFMTFLMSRRSSGKWILANVLVAVAVVVAFSFTAIVSDLEGLGFDTSLTGRTYVWERTLAAISGDDELLGYGFGSFQLPTFDSLFNDYRPSHAHSSFVQAFFETGSLGLVILVALVLCQLVVAWRAATKSNEISYSLFLVWFCLFGSLTGGVIYGGALTTPFCLMMLFLAIETRSSNPSGR
jgi:exopolysaccharide production protein ExoQ